VLVLLSFALVLVATVLLVLGLLNDDGLTLIYISMASSLAAAIVLVVAYRLNKPRTEQRAAAPAPLPISDPVPATVGASPATAVSPALDEPAPAPSEGEWLATDQDAWGEPEGAGDGWQEGDEVEFPIADYDTLTVGQILPLLPQLYTDEIDVVEERERLTKARPQVLAKLAELRDASGVADEPVVAAADPLATYTETAEAGWDDEDWFPIEDYESLSAAQIRPLLPELDPEELTLVRTRELALGRRRSLLDEIDRMLGVAPAPAKRAAPATRPTAGAPAPAAKRAAASKAPAARKTAAKAPAKKATTSKAATTKAATTKAATTKAATTKAATTKAATTKAATTKAAASGKKAAPAKATAAKKGTAAKKATPAKKSTKR
jgi:hypothetical protein